jgi:hypothetical protein
MTSQPDVGMEQLKLKPPVIAPGHVVLSALLPQYRDDQIGQADRGGTSDG